MAFPPWSREGVVVGAAFVCFISALFIIRLPYQQDV
jgi:hypothetical protein